MHIVFLELKGYKRLRLSRIDKLTLTPTVKMQLILGRNGCGKSSLLQELSPLPAHHSQYVKGGYKKIGMTHQGVSYELVSDFTKGNKHSFLKEGVELNEGGTYQVQQRLVLETFRYHEKLHDLLIGRTLFTQMRPNERREWITQLSEMDWTFAFQLFVKLKTAARDALGALRHQQQRLTQEVDRYRQLASETNLEEHLGQVRTRLNSLLKAMTPGIAPYQSLHAQLQSEFDLLQANVIELIEKVPYQPYGWSYQNLTAVDEAIAELKTQQQVNRYAISQVGSSISELQSLLTTLTVEGSTDQALTLEEKIEQTKSLQAQILAQPAVFDQIPNAPEVVRFNQQVLSDVMDLMNKLPDNSDGRYSRKQLLAYQEQLETTLKHIDQLQIQFHRTQERLSHLEGQHDSRCPQCQYVWKEGVDPAEVLQLTQMSQNLSESLSKERQAVAVLREAIEGVEAYSSLWMRFKGYTQTYPLLQPLWMYLLDHHLLTHRPYENLSILQDWDKDAKRAAELDRLTLQLEQLQTVWSIQQQFGDAQRAGDKLTQLHRDLNGLTEQSLQLKQQLSALEQWKTTVISYQSRVEALTTRLAQFDLQLQHLLTSLFNDHLEHDVNLLHQQMSALQAKLSDRQTLEGVIASLETDVKQLELHHQAYQTLANALSPTEGLIADRLREAIFSLLDQMNTLIAAVWSYDLVIQECGMEQSDLDYKFPVMIDTADQINKDISECSKGQQEMINLAFKLTAMMFLELTDYPLFLDEPGDGFDEEHRQQIMSFIRHLMDSGQYGQLFMVSHVANSHGGFVDAQTLVLDPANIVLPSLYNTHVVIE